jgi:hypothetical protein
MLFFALNVSAKKDLSREEVEETIRFAVDMMVFNEDRISELNDAIAHAPESPNYKRAIHFLVNEPMKKYVETHKECTTSTCLRRNFKRLVKNASDMYLIDDYITKTLLRNVQNIATSKAGDMFQVEILPMDNGSYEQFLLSYLNVYKLSMLTRFGTSFKNNFSNEKFLEDRASLALLNDHRKGMTFPRVGELPAHEMVLMIAASNLPSEFTVPEFIKLSGLVFKNKYVEIAPDQYLMLRDVLDSDELPKNQQAAINFLNDLEKLLEKNRVLINYYLELSNVYANRLYRRTTDDTNLAYNNFVLSFDSLPKVWLNFSPQTQMTAAIASAYLTGQVQAEKLSDIWDRPGFTQIKDGKWDKIIKIAYPLTATVLLVIDPTRLSPVFLSVLYSAYSLYKENKKTPSDVGDQTLIPRVKLKGGN